MVAVLVIVAALVAVILLYAASRPESCEFSRSIHIAAPPEKIFPFIDNPRAMNEWNPFTRADPNISLAYSGPDRGVGAANDFSGNGQVGAGRAEIVESLAPSKVAIALTMTRPMRCRNHVVFTLAPQDGGARVTWAMSGRRPFIGKLMSLVVNMEKMVGDAFDKGLAELKALAEAA